MYICCIHNLSGIKPWVYHSIYTFSLRVYSCETCIKKKKKKKRITANKMINPIQNTACQRQNAYSAFIAYLSSWKSGLYNATKLLTRHSPGCLLKLLVQEKHLRCHFEILKLHTTQQWKSNRTGRVREKCMIGFEAILAKWLGCTSCSNATGDIHDIGESTICVFEHPLCAPLRELACLVTLRILAKVL